MDISLYVKKRKEWLSTVSLHCYHSTNAGVLKSPLTYSMYRNFRSSPLFSKTMCEQQRIQRGQHTTMCRRLNHKERCSRSLLSGLKVPMVHCEESKSDKNETTTPKEQSVVTEAEIKDYINNQTGMDRVKYIFKTNEQAVGGRSDEFFVIVMMTMNCGFLAFFFFGRLAFYQAKKEFSENNKLTVFPSRKIYKSMMHEYGMKKMMYHGSRIGSRILLLTGMFFVFSECIAAYRAKSSMIEYVTAGIAAGALQRCYYGFRGMALGGILGSLYGAISGSLIYGSMYMLDETQEQRLYRRTKAALEEKKKYQVEQISSTPLNDTVSLSS